MKKIVKQMKIYFYRLILYYLLILYKNCKISQGNS